MSDALVALEAAAAFYERVLGQQGGAAARAELQKRNLPPEPGVFRLGAAPDAWDGLVQHFRARGISPAAGEAAGLLVPRKGSGHYDRFRNRLMFPVSDELGQVIAFSGRILPDARGHIDKEAGKYVNSPETAVFRKGEVVFGLAQARDAMAVAGGAVLVEGNFDVVSLHAHGMRNVVAPLGTAFTTEQAHKLRSFVPEVTLFFDGDEAGRHATARALDPCRDAGLDVRVAVVPVGRDPDELVRSHGAEHVRDLLDRSRRLEEHLIAELVEDELGPDMLSPIAMARRLPELCRRIDSVIDDSPRRRALEAYAKRCIARMTPFQARVGFRAPASPRRGRDRVLDVVHGILRAFPELVPELEAMRGATRWVQAALDVPPGTPSVHRHVDAARRELSVNVAKLCFRR